MNTRIIEPVSLNLFEQIIQVSPRKIRETLYRKLGIKENKKSVLALLKQAQDIRPKQLLEHLKQNDTKEINDLCQELVRNFLFHKRPMLKKALDILNVKNDEGLVEEDLDFLKTLPKEKAKSLYDELCLEFPQEEVKLYLAFMEIPFSE